MLLPLALAATVALSGCATLETDVVAKVGDVEFSQEEFETLLADADPTGGDDVTGDLARGVTSSFVVVELLKADLEALGVPVPEFDDGDTAPAAALNAEFELLVQSWVSLPAETLLDDEVRAYYEGGHESSGIVCASHILVATETEADQVIDELDAGAAFADVALARSTDPGSAQAGGSLGCSPADQFAVTFVPEFATAALDAEIGVPTAPVETQFGFHVIRLDPIDELDTGSIVPLRVRTLGDRYDVSVASRIGRWDPSGAVVPVG